MLLCGAIDELTKGRQGHTVAYFFCQATDSRINNSESVLRGLIHMLVEQQPELGTHLPSRPVSDDCNAWFELSEIFSNILGDQRIKKAVLFIDALNECDESQPYPRILDTICQTTNNPRVKWLLTSRHNDEIEENLTEAASQSTLCLELKDNALEVARAVRHYIKESLMGIRALQADEKLSSKVQKMMEEKSQDTFLWVSLVVQELKLLRPRHKGRALGIVDQTPRGLHSLYERMSRKIEDLESDDSSLCRDVLLRMLTAFRPLQLAELGTMIQHSPEDTAEVVRLCGSFLTTPDEALPLSKRSVYVVHHSAQLYLQEAQFLDFHGCWKEMNHTLFVEALASMQKHLKPDFYGLDDPGKSITNFKLIRPEPDPLAGFRYYCEYWIQHFSLPLKMSPTGPVEASDRDKIESFLEKQLLFWIEALGFLERLPQGLDGLRMLKASINTGSYSAHFLELVDDAVNYMVTHLVMIQKYPLQTYATGLLFSPQTSITRQNFSAHSPSWVSLAFGVEDSWTANTPIMQAAGEISLMAFSGDDRLLACISKVSWKQPQTNALLQIWDIETGHLRHEKEFKEKVTGMNISYDGSSLIFFSENGWFGYSTASSCYTARWQQLNSEPLGANRSHKLSPDLSLMATCHEVEPQTICLTDTTTGDIKTRLRTTGRVSSFGFLNHGKWFAAASKTWQRGLQAGLVIIWDLATGSRIDEMTVPTLHQMFTLPGSSYLITVSLGAVDEHHYYYNMWDVPNSTSVWTKWFPAGYYDTANVLLSPDGNSVVLLGASSSYCYILDAQTGSTLFKVPFLSERASLKSDENSLDFYHASFSVDGYLLIPRRFKDVWQTPNREFHRIVDVSKGESAKLPHQATFTHNTAGRWAIARKHDIIEVSDMKHSIVMEQTRYSRSSDLRLSLDGQLRHSYGEEADTQFKADADGSYLLPLPDDKLSSMEVPIRTTGTSVALTNRWDNTHTFAHSSDGSIAACQSWNQSDPSKPPFSITLWDAKYSFSMGYLDNPPNSGAQGLKPVPLVAHGNRIALADIANTIYIWDHDLSQWILRLPTKLKTSIESVVIDWTTVRFVSHHQVFTRPITVPGTRVKVPEIYGVDCSGQWITRGGKREINLPLRAMPQLTKPGPEARCIAAKRAIAVIPGTIAIVTYADQPIIFNIHND